MAYRFLPAKRHQLYLMPPSLRDWQAERPPGAVLLRRGRRARLVGLLRALQGTQRRITPCRRGASGAGAGTMLGAEEPRIGKSNTRGWRPCGRRRAGAAQAARSYSWTMPPRTSRRLTLPPVFKITGRASLRRRKVGCGANTSRRSPPSAQLAHPRDQRVHPHASPLGWGCERLERCSYFPFRPIAAGPKGP